jgi:hypothetical protein
MFRQGDADAEKHRIARGDHADQRSPAFRDLRHQVGQRRRPGQARAPVIGDHREMPSAADQRIGVVDQHAAARGHPVEAVFADSDDAEPAPGHAS